MKVLSEEEIIRALTALVEHQAARMRGDVAKFGELQWDPNTREVAALSDRLERLGVFRTKE